MTTTTMNSEKILLAQRILAIDNPDLLFKVRDQVNAAMDGSMEPSHHLPKVSYSEYRSRLEQAAEDARQGQAFACEDIHSNLEKQYPWLCDAVHLSTL